jgi:hypothetical protein
LRHRRKGSGQLSDPACGVAPPRFLAETAGGTTDGIGSGLPSICILRAGRTEDEQNNCADRQKLQSDDRQPLVFKKTKLLTLKGNLVMPLRQSVLVGRTGEWRASRVVRRGF